VRTTIASSTFFSLKHFERTASADYEAGTLGPVAALFDSLSSFALSST
jgi:hypothetical protein